MMFERLSSWWEYRKESTESLQKKLGNTEDFIQFLSKETLVCRRDSGSRHVRPLHDSISRYSMKCHKIRKELKYRKEKETK